jgi:hypothetical protein
MGVAGMWALKRVWLLFHLWATAFEQCAPLPINNNERSRMASIPASALMLCTKAGQQAICCSRSVVLQLLRLQTSLLRLCMPCSLLHIQVLRVVMCCGRMPAAATNNVAVAVSAIPSAACWKVFFGEGRVVRVGRSAHGSCVTGGCVPPRLVVGLLHPQQATCECATHEILAESASHSEVQSCVCDAGATLTWVAPCTVRVCQLCRRNAALPISVQMHGLRV